MEKIKIEKLTFSYPKQDKPALDGINLKVEKGAFLLVCGKSGCGKSTLLRHLKPSLAPNGFKTGKIEFDGTNIDDTDERMQASQIGFVQQSPENQIVTDKVWHELSFGLESLGEEQDTIRRRVAEISSFFGLEKIFYSDTASLSGGQKQLINLASVMVLQPTVLILDEPTSQLDPIAASEFLSVLGKINRELGVTVILTEHRLEETFSYASEIAYMENGKILFTGSPLETAKALRGKDYFSAMPAAMRIWDALNPDDKCPLTVSEGSGFLSKYSEKHLFSSKIITDSKKISGEEILHAENLWFRYEKNGNDIVKGLKLSLHKGEFFALLGGNGAGKTTTLNLLSGIEKAYRGEITRKGTVSVLPQNPQTLFQKKTVYEDLLEVFKKDKITKAEKDKLITDTAELCHIKQFFDKHPYDLSGGEQQRTALCKILLTKPDILLLDEPTKGMDSQFKEEFANIISELLLEGKSVFMVSHDIEFCAEHTDMCALFFDGSIISSGEPHEFFSSCSFYTTAASRMSKHIIKNAVTVDDITSAFGIESVRRVPEHKYHEPSSENNDTIDKTTPSKLPLWRKISASATGMIALFLFFYTSKNTDLTELITPEGLTKLSGKHFLLYGLLIFSLLLTFIFIDNRGSQLKNINTSSQDHKISGRTKLSAAVTLLLIPLTLFIWIAYTDTHKYNIISLIILVECMLPFFIVFEKKRPAAKEIAVIAVLCSIAIAGRAAFFMLPQFKPVLAVTVISGVALGSETGFLVGAVTMLASNVFFSQGPWTPWQMFAMGIIGFFAGILFKKGLLCKNRISLAVFGAVSAIIIYGLIMNTASAFIWSTETISFKILLPYYITGLPLDCVHAFATAFFLMAAAEPMLEKLDRIKIKYGLT